MFESITALRASLTEALASPAGLDGDAHEGDEGQDAARVDTIRALEELICTASAAQAYLARRLDASQRAAQAERGAQAARQGAGVAAQVAWARRESPHRGQRHLALARIVEAELPHTWRAWREGRITEWHATLVARETACLELADRLAVDALLAQRPGGLEAMGPAEVAGAAAAQAARLDPASVVLRRRRAESDRHVSLRPAPDTMTWLTALLPVKDGVAVLASLRRAADSANATGDPRSRGQVMADALVRRALDADGSGAPDVGAPAIVLDLVMTHTSLFGDDEQPAFLDGYGAVPAELAREIVARTLDEREALEVRRLYTHPRTGELVAMESRSRTYRGGLRRFIRLRDQVCRTPWCRAPIRHEDHAEEHGAGGPTSVVNGQGLCEACNHAKQAPGWRARPGPDGSVATTLPTGHTYRTRPPAIADVRVTPIRIEYVLAG